jgi:hypothetical protein
MKGGRQLGKCSECAAGQIGSGHRVRPANAFDIARNPSPGSVAEGRCGARLAIRKEQSPDRLRPGRIDQFAPHHRGFWITDQLRQHNSDIIQASDDSGADIEMTDAAVALRVARPDPLGQLQGGRSDDCDGSGVSALGAILEIAPLGFVGAVFTARPPRRQVSWPQSAYQSRCGNRPPS